MCKCDYLSISDNNDFILTDDVFIDECVFYADGVPYVLGGIDRKPEDG